MSARLAFRLGAIGLAALVVLVTALEAGRKTPAAPLAPAPVIAAPAYPKTHQAELARCQALGAAGAQEPTCLKAWADARTRFLGGAEAKR